VEAELGYAAVQGAGDTIVAIVVRHAAAGMEQGILAHVIDALFLGAGVVVLAVFDGDAATGGVFHPAKVRRQVASGSDLTHVGATICVGYHLPCFIACPGKPGIRIHHRVGPATGRIDVVRAVPALVIHAVVGIAGVLILAMYLINTAIRGLVASTGASLKVAAAWMAQVGCNCRAVIIGRAGGVLAERWVLDTGEDCQQHNHGKIDERHPAISSLP
jgi:hypothetical protein